MYMAKKNNKRKLPQTDSLYKDFPLCKNPNIWEQVNREWVEREKFYKNLLSKDLDNWEEIERELVKRDAMYRGTINNGTANNGTIKRFYRELPGIDEETEEVNN